MIITFCGNSSYIGDLEEEERLINLLEVVICGNQVDYLFSYVKTHYGGAYKTLLYAHKHKKPYTNLYNGNYELY